MSAKTLWTVPLHSRSEVDRAGQILVLKRLDDYSEALDIVNNWRAAHSFPLNTIQIHLRQNASRVCKNPLVAQRIKRLASIKTKLEARETMQLSQMQDIGGCRVVLPDIHAVNSLLALLKKSRSKNKIMREYDYIERPRQTGYRSVHLVYKYRGTRSDDFGGLRIEMQLRSRRQHAWASAVEIVDTMTKQSLKSGIGDENWLRFFKLMGSAIALIEHTQPVLDIPGSKEELAEEILHYAAELRVAERLEAYRHALLFPKLVHVADNSYFVIHIMPEKPGVPPQLGIQPYKKSEIGKATLRYNELERELQPGEEVVLVSVRSISMLKRAYPNYYMDADFFLEIMKRFTGIT